MRALNNLPRALASRGATGVYPIGIYANGVSLSMSDCVSGEGHSAVEICISKERLRPYRLSCDGSLSEAIALYEHNTDVSAALYGPLQALEVAVRNAFHSSLSETYGDWWFNEGGVITHLFQRKRISDAQVDLAKDGKDITPGRVVASLMFGFWTGCLAGPYENGLWRKGGLARAFQNGGEKPSRNKVNGMMGPIRLIRNRAAHHEPLLYYNLPKHHENALKLISWLCPATAEWATARSTFDSVYNEEMARKLLKPADRPA